MINYLPLHLVSQSFVFRNSYRLFYAFFVFRGFSVVFRNCAFTSFEFPHIYFSTFSQRYFVLQDFRVINLFFPFIGVVTKFCFSCFVFYFRSLASSYTFPWSFLPWIWTGETLYFFMFRSLVSWFLFVKNLPFFMCFLWYLNFTYFLIGDFFRFVRA